MKPALFTHAEQLLMQADPAFASGAHILTPASEFHGQDFHRLVRMLTTESTIAFTCPVLDIVASNGPLRYARGVGQRAFAMYFCKPIESHAEFWVAVVHEGGHHLAETHPSRDDTDEDQALQSFFADALSGKMPDAHGQRWVKATALLAGRMAMLGAPIDVDLLFDGYGDARSIMGSIEAQIPLTNIPIESCLKTTRPKASKPTRSTSEPGPKASKPNANPLQFVGGELCEFLPGGKVRTFPSLDGRKPGRTFDSLQALFARQDIAKDERKKARKAARLGEADGYASTRPAVML